MVASLPCLGLRIGNGSPNFQKKYMKVNQTIQAKRSLWRCTTNTQNNCDNKAFLICSYFNSFLVVLTQANVADHKVANIKRHHEDKNK